MVTEYVNSVPFAVGVNNHMGSRFTEYKQGMDSFLEVIKDMNMFFVDSVTTSKSVGFTLAAELGIRSARRNVFLDHVEDEEYTRRQVLKLEEIVMQKGKAIGIGHPHMSTIKGLKFMIKRFREKGIAIVPVSEIVN